MNCPRPTRRPDRKSSKRSSSRYKWQSRSIPRPRTIRKPSSRSKKLRPNGSANFASKFARSAQRSRSNKRKSACRIKSLCYNANRKYRNFARYRKYYKTLSPRKRYARNTRKSSRPSFRQFRGLKCIQRRSYDRVPSRNRSLKSGQRQRSNGQPYYYRPQCGNATHDGGNCAILKT